MQNDSHDTRGATAEAISLNGRLIGAGVKKSFASHLATGRRRPSLTLALELERRLGIPPAAWREGPEAVRAALEDADAASPAAGAAE